MSKKSNENLLNKKPTVKESMNFETFSRSLFGAIPYVGTLLTEVLFESRSRLKQKRINDFIINLQKVFEKTDQNLINKNIIQEEGYGDVLENILIDVSKTRSEKKVELYSNLLLNQTLKPLETDRLELFYDIIKGLNQNEILIIDYYSTNTNNSLNEHYEQIMTNLSSRELLSQKFPNNSSRGIYKATPETTILRTQINNCNKNINYHLDEYRQKYYKMMNSIGCDFDNKLEYGYYFNNLVNKKLLESFSFNELDEDINHHSITDLGKELITFLKQAPSQ